MNDYIRLGHEIGLDWNYVLTKDVVFNFGNKFFVPCEFKNDWCWIRMEGDELFLTAYKDYAWDGCSVVPDFEGTIVASIPHDIFYQFEKELAQAFGWSGTKVLSFANKIFKKAMEQTDTNCIVKYTYYWGVVVFGLGYRRIKQLFTSIF